MNKNNTKKILNKVKTAVDEYCDWLWHEDLGCIEKLEETLSDALFVEEPNFEYLALEVLKYIEVINEYCNVQTETIQYRTNIWCDEDEFLQNGGDEIFDSFGEYLEYHKVCTFEDLKEILIEELFVVHVANFKGEK
jgi:hypothetical protein